MWYDAVFWEVSYKKHLLLSYFNLLKIQGPGNLAEFCDELGYNTETDGWPFM